jgi:hypothetical protein
MKLSKHKNLARILAISCQPPPHLQLDAKFLLPLFLQEIVHIQLNIYVDKVQQIQTYIIMNKT